MLPRNPCTHPTTRLFFSRATRKTRFIDRRSGVLRFFTVFLSISFQLLISLTLRDQDDVSQFYGKRKRGREAFDRSRGAENRSAARGGDWNGTLTICRLPASARRNSRSCLSSVKSVVDLSRDVDAAAIRITRQWLDVVSFNEEDVNRTRYRSERAYQTIADMALRWQARLSIAAILFMCTEGNY